MGMEPGSVTDAERAQHVVSTRDGDLFGMQAHLGIGFEEHGINQPKNGGVEHVEPSHVDRLKPMGATWCHTTKSWHPV